MHCPLEDKPTMRDHLMCSLIWLLTYIGAWIRAGMGVDTRSDIHRHFS